MCKYFLTEEMKIKGKNSQRNRHDIKVCKKLVKNRWNFGETNELKN